MYFLCAPRSLAALLSAFALALGSADRASAQTWTQTGAGPFSWNVAGNWNGGVPNSASANVLFTTLGGPATQAITLDAAITLGTLDLTNSATSYTFTNGTSGSFTFDNGGATAATVTVGGGSLAQTINASIVVAAGQTAGLSVTNNGSNLVAFGGTIDTGGNPLAVAGSGNTTMSGIISGTGVLIKNGAGTLTLTALNTFSGGVTVNAGTLALTTAGGLPASSAGWST